MYEINNIDKRRRTIRHFSNYFLVGLAITGLTIVVILAASGYDIDRRTGEVIQNGVLLLETQPEDATVYIDGQAESAKTSAKYAIPEGRYAVRVEKAGFLPWQNSVEIFGSQVNWLYYPLLIPESIETQALARIDGLRFIAHNRDRDLLLTNQAQSPQRLTLFETNSEDVAAERIELPESAFVSRGDAVVGQVSFVEWTDDGRYVLLNYQYDERSDFILADLEQPQQSRLLDRIYARDIDSVRFGADDRSLLVLDEGLLFTVSIDATDLPLPVDAQVSRVIVNAPDVWIQKSSGGETTLRTLEQPTRVVLASDNPAAEIATGRWDGVEHIAVSNEDLVRIYTGPDRETPSNNIVSKILRVGGRTQTTMSPEGRFLSVHSARDSLVYDFETRKTYELDYGTADQLRWLDGYRFIYERNGQMRMLDFDGANEYQIASFESAYGAFIDSDLEAIYAVARSSNGQLQLRTSQLTIDE